MEFSNIEQSLPRIRRENIMSGFTSTDLGPKATLSAEYHDPIIPTLNILVNTVGKETVGQTEATFMSKNRQFIWFAVLLDNLDDVETHLPKEVQTSFMKSIAALGQKSHLDERKEMDSDDSKLDDFSVEMIDIDSLQSIPSLSALHKHLQMKNLTDISSFPDLPRNFDS